MTKQSKQNLLYSILAMFFLYFISILSGNTILGNILSPIVAFLSSLLIFVSIKQIANYKLYAIFIFLSTLIWGIADFLWLIYDNILFIDPSNNYFINTLYVLPNLFFVILLTHYVFKNFNKWHLYQILIDLL